MSGKIARLEPLAASTAIATKAEYAEQHARWKALIVSGALPKHINTPEKAIAIALMGEAFGWHPMRAVRSIYIVDGRPEMSAESMLALVREKMPNARIYPIERTRMRAAVKVKRDITDEHEPWCEIEFTHEDAAKAGLLKKDVWQKYEPDMLWARCVSRTCRVFFSDVVAGAYTFGEIEDLGAIDTTATDRQVGPREVEDVDDDERGEEPPEVTASLDQRPKVEPEDVPDEGPTDPGSLGDGLDQRPEEEGAIGFGRGEKAPSELFDFAEDGSVVKR